MTAVRFQTQLGDALKEWQGRQFIYKAPDGIAGNWRPADWLLCHNGEFIAVEAKQTRQKGWALADWTPQQRAAAQIVLQSGGHYWLVINWRGATGTKTPDTKTIAIPGGVALQLPDLLTTRKSLTHDMATDLLPCIDVAWVPGKGWDVGYFLTIGLPQN